MKKLFRINKEYRAGLYLTISFHLIVIIIMLCYSIHSIVEGEHSFVLDFTKQEELEAAQREAEFKESVSEELDALIAQAQQTTPRNVVVDASSSAKPLKDDRNTNSQELYDEARRLQEKLDAASKELEKEQGSDDVPVISKEKEEKKESYKGPSVISYRLEGRKAVSLPIPAYKCMGGGDVSVAIVVNRKGYVTGVKIIENLSSPDQCLRDYALKAAKRSRFTASDKATERQVGDIVYRFIAQ